MTPTSAEALKHVVDEIRARWMPRPTRRARTRRPAERQAWATAAAKTIVLVGDRTNTILSECGRFLPTGVRPPTPAQFRGAGGLRGALRVLSGGNLGMDDKLKPWTGNLFHGLKLAGALRQDAGRGWSVWEQTHGRLLADLQAMPLPHQLEPGGRRNGVRRLRRCAAAMLPPADRFGVDVLAGLLAGAVHVRIDGFDWLDVPATSDVLRLLDDWAIPRRHSRTFRGRDYVAVSPFFAALLADEMPPCSHQRILNMLKPGDCPFLPLMFWDWCLSKPGMRWPPFANALPFACCRRTAFDRGFGRRELHRRYVVEKGIGHIDRRIIRLCEKWFARQAKGRLVSNCVQSPAPLAESAPGPALVALSA
ncbi:MAG TPA: hypothetical protein PLE77_09105 [Kiritimatiellia bacterium]|nr:hypothetical protein [Kiritimatiellia bacterium]